MDISVIFLGLLRNSSHSRIAKEGVYEAVQVALILSGDYLKSLEKQVHDGNVSRCGKSRGKGKKSDVDLETIFEQLQMPFTTLVTDIHLIVRNPKWRKANLHKEELGKGDHISSRPYAKRLAEIPEEELKVRKHHLTHTFDL